MTTLQPNASQHTKSKRDQLLFNNPERQGRIKGGALWASARGPALSGARRFFGPRGSLWPHVFGTALHGFGRTYHICSGHHVLISNINRVPFCVISCKHLLRMRKIAFQRF